MAIEIYWGSGSPYSWRVLLALEYKRLAYDSHLLQFSKQEHQSPQMLALNPRGRLPVLKDGKLVGIVSRANLLQAQDGADDHRAVGIGARKLLGKPAPGGAAGLRRVTADVAGIGAKMERRQAKHHQHFAGRRLWLGRRVHRGLCPAHHELGPSKVRLALRTLFEP